MSTIEVVMATYNGAKFITEQIDSIMSQTYQDIILVIHDDGSSDGTHDLLMKAKRTYGNKIIIKNHPPCGGATKNFSYLLENTSEQYVMCADQDDLWYERKVENALKAIKFYESIYEESTPLLIHTDLELIDSNGRMLQQRLWKYQRLDPSWTDKFSRLLTQNVVTGCTIILNRSLLNKALPIPQEAVMHDWWFALVACAFGKVVYLSEPDIGYRQHGNNVLGAKKFDVFYVVQKALSFFNSDTKNESLLKTSSQAKAFSLRYQISGYANVANIYSELPRLSKLSRAISILRNDFRKIGWRRQIAWLTL